MNNHRFILEPYSGLKSRHRCPNCDDKGKPFTLYIDTETGQYVHPTVGRCNRVNKCAYHYTPKQYFEDCQIPFDPLRTKRGAGLRAPKQHSKPTSFISIEQFEASLKNYVNNHFIKFLTMHFGPAITNGLIEKYFIGTAKHWSGSTVFWQIDLEGNVRTGKIMLYCPDTGKRIKEPFSHIHWAHKALDCPDFHLQQCLFGEHLLTDRTKRVAIVESEKTAIISSVYFPQLVWLATGSISNLNAANCSILKGRNVVLFPDQNGFENWSKKARELSHIAAFRVSDLLELEATRDETKNGFDLADYLIQYNIEGFSQVE